MQKYTCLFFIIILQLTISCSTSSKAKNNSKNIGGSKAQQIVLDQESLEIEQEDPVKSPEIEERPKPSLGPKEFLGTIYTPQYGYETLYREVEMNPKAQEHCSRIKCYKPMDRPAEEEIGMYGAFTVKERDYKDIYFTLATDVFTDQKLEIKAGEIVSVYRLGFDGWSKVCNTTLLIPPSKFDDYDGTRISVDVDMYKNGWTSTVLCNQYFYDGRSYVPIDVTGSQILVYEDNNESFFRLNINSNTYAYLRESPLFYAYDQRKGSAYVSLYSDFTRDSYFDRSSPKDRHSKLNKTQKIDSQKTMILDFLKNGWKSQYAIAVSKYLPMQVSYEESSDSIVFLLSNQLPYINLAFDTKILTKNPNCDLFRSYHGKYLTPEGFYHCLYEVQSEWQRIRIPREEVSNISLSQNSPKLSGATIDFQEDGTFEIEGTFASSVSINVRGLLFPPPSPGFFKKMREGLDFTLEEMPDVGFESCVKERDGKKMSCSYFIATDPSGC